MFQVSRLPEAAIKPIFSESQWAKLIDQFVEANAGSRSSRKMATSPKTMWPLGPTERPSPVRNAGKNEDRTTMRMRSPGREAIASTDFRSSGTAACRQFFAIALIAGVVVSIAARPVRAQMPAPRFGEVVPRDVREMYDRGLQYLATTQVENGDWPGGRRARNGPGHDGDGA